VRDVTVGMPVYNDPDGLRRSVPTIFSQTWEGPLRLLVIDDGSTDETPAVLAELAARYGHVDVIRNEVNRGRPHARNQILEHAGDGYLAWLDADDVWHPRKLELQMLALEAAERVEADRALLCTSPIRLTTVSGSDRVRRAVVSGDQLLRALTGELYPYLQTMVGKASAFRDAGGFDPRLPRRQDYEFLLRFVSGGGRVVTTSTAQPLMTYVKSDVGRSGREVAAANRVIAAEHRDLYRRYGRRFARECHIKRLLLVARFYENNGQGVQAALYRARARSYTPLERLVRTRTAALAVRGARRALRPLAGRASGPPRGPARPAVRPAEEVKQARRLIGEGDAPTAIARLEQLLTAEAATAPSDAWFVLSEAHRRLGDAAAAQRVLERGVRTTDGDGELRMRLLELLVVRERWEDALELHRSTPVDHDRYRTARTFALLALAHRATGDLEGARVIATEGARRHPKDGSIRGELHKAHEALTDWSTSLQIPRPPIVPADMGGTVDSLGFLRGGDAVIQGRVSADLGHAPEVRMLLNGKAIATTNAATLVGGDEGRRGSFALNCRGMREFLGDGDVISFDCDRRLLTIEGAGPRCIVTTGYPSRAGDLIKLIREGHIFTKFGRLRKGYTPERKREILTFFDEISAVVAEVSGTPAYPFYGNLLGAIRDNDFIAHDVGGFDMGYVSRHHQPRGVRDEFLELCRTLLDRGYDLRLAPWCAMVRRDPRDPFFMDINYGWFDPAGELQLSYGWRFAPVADEPAFRTPRTAPMASHLVAVPGTAEAMLEQMYGPNWAIPDQGFELAVRLHRESSYLLSDDELRTLESEHPGRAHITALRDDDEGAVDEDGPDEPVEQVDQVDALGG
jgi:glycosyltransferase involved in cell wall biosynthesis